MLKDSDGNELQPGSPVVVVLGNLTQLGKVVRVDNGGMIIGRRGNQDVVSPSRVTIEIDILGAPGQPVAGVFTRKQPKPEA